APPKEVDSSRVAVRAGEDAGFGALFGRKRMVDLGAGGDHFFPPEFVPEVLRKRAAILHFGARHFDAESVHVGNDLFDGQNRNVQRKGNYAQRENDRRRRDFKPTQLRVAGDGHFPEDATGREYYWVNGREVV